MRNAPSFAGSERRFASSSATQTSACSPTGNPCPESLSSRRDEVKTRRTPAASRPWEKLAAPLVQLHITGVFPAMSAPSHTSTAAAEAGSMMPTRSPFPDFALMKDASTKARMIISRAESTAAPSASMSREGERMACRNAVSTRFRPSGTERVRASPVGNHAAGGSAASPAVPSSPAAARIQSPTVRSASSCSMGWPEISSSRTLTLMSDKLSIPRSVASVAVSSITSTPLSSRRMANTLSLMAFGTSAKAAPSGVCIAGAGSSFGVEPSRKWYGTASAGVMSAL